jgi:hypothetical protein
MDYNYDISQYTRKDLETMLGLPPNYDTSIIEIKYNIMKNKIHAHTSIDETLKQNINSFLEKAKNVLEVGDRQFPSVVSTTTPHSILQRDVQPYTNTYPNLIQTGTLNPIERKTITRIVNIDTKFRVNYETTLSSDCTFDLPIRFSNVVTMELSSFEFPTLYYLTSISRDNYYYFTLEINHVIKYVCIPGDIRNFVDVIAFLNSYFQLIGQTEPDFSGIVFYFTITNPSTQSGSVVIENQSINGNPPNPFIIDFSPITQDNRPLSSNLGWLLGFRNSIYQNGTAYNSEALANFVCDKYLFLVVDEYVNNKSDIFYSCFTNSILNKNIIGRIILHPNNTLEVVTEPRQYFGQIDITKLKVQLLDEYGRPICYKNIDYSFCLKLNTIYNI